MDVAAGRSRAADYITLAKPRLNMLVVATALAGYVMGHGDMGDVAKVLSLVIGTALVASGASAFNQIYERGTDALMLRTRMRPMADGRIAQSEAAIYATVLCLAGLALLIAGVGLFGVLAYGVAQRRREIGVRAALGATPGALIRLVVRQGAAITIAGLAVGLVGAYIAAAWIGGFLFGVTPRDPLSFVAVPIVLFIVATLAAFVPARRAATIDPLRAMRG